MAEKLKNRSPNPLPVLQKTIRKLIRTTIIMYFGLNTPFFTQNPDYGELPQTYFVEKLQELGVKYIRIPLIWNQLVEIKDGNFVWNSKIVNRYRQILNAITKDAKVLGFTINPPPEIAKEYFFDRPSITHNYKQFLQGCLQRFPEIQEWEVWNEPNASDFYLSRPEGAGHRPWTSQEFIDDVLIPGAETIRQAQPNAKICVAGLAENGIVGHYDKVPALSNRLPKDEFFNSLRSSGVHDHFYFIPEFGFQFIQDLKQVISDRRRLGKSQLFDACAFHPYPYFMLHKKQNKDLFQSSLSLIEDFNQMFQEAGIDGLEVWLTEVGARSFDVYHNHLRDESLQSQFISQLPQASAIGDPISRIYWYKLLDRPFDLRQEKSFGVLDHDGKAKQSFFELQKLFYQTQETTSVFRDSFAYGNKYQQGSFNPLLWDMEASSTYGFATTSVDSSGRDTLLLSPGRYEKDFILLQAKSSLTMGNEFYLDFAADYEIPTLGVDFQLALEISNSQTKTTLLQVTLNNEERLSLGIMADGLNETTTIARRYNFAKIRSLTGFQVEILKNEIAIALNFDRKTLWKTFSLPQPLLPTPINLALRLTKLSPHQSNFVRLSSLVARTNPPKPHFKTFPLELVTPEQEWSFQLPPISQIQQDEWVLRSTRFKQKGYFVEIGGHDGVANSNTINLEEHFDWNGIVVEANPRWYAKVCQNRSCIATNYAICSQPEKELEFVDAGAIGGLISHLQDDIHADLRQQKISSGSVIEVPAIRGDEILARYNAPEYIEYMSVDTEGSELEVLKSINFHRWKVALLTVEHGGQADKREEIWQYMQTYGYQRIRVWFEDWYYHISYLAKILEISEADARLEIERANGFIPYHRGSKLLELGIAAKKQGKFDEALNYFLEATKSYYPNNISAYLAAATEYQRRQEFQKTIDLLNTAAIEYPNHPSLLKKSAIIFAQQHRYVLLTRVLERIFQKHQNLIEHRDISQIIVDRKDELIRINRENIQLQQQNPHVVEHLNELVGNG